MVRSNKQLEEKVFDKLPDFGYSNKTAHLIWLWYHPTEKYAAQMLKEAGKA